MGDDVEISKFSYISGGNVICTLGKTISHFI